MRPRVRAVERDADRHVTKQPDAALVGVAAKLMPLVVEQELDDLDIGDLLIGAGLERRHRLGVTMHVVWSPFGPGPLSVLRFEDAVERVVVQPDRIVFLNEPIAGGHEVGFGARLEAGRREPQQPGLDRDQRAVVHVVLRQGSKFLRLVFLEEAFFN